MSAARTTIVTGAGSGIGTAIAVELAKLGWPVALGGRRVERLEETATLVRDAGGTAFVHQLDVADAASAETFFSAVERELGPLDVLVNNAALATPGWVHTLPANELQQQVATNLTGPILMSRLAIASMRARDAAGDLVFITSDATRHPRPRLSTYCATKAGLETFADTLVLELEGTGIRASKIRVGPTLSEFGFGWPMDELEDLMTYWSRFGFGRHNHILEPVHVAQAAVTAVTAPPGVHLDTIEVQPHAPVGDSGPAQALERPSS
ncbi:MAG: SDR family NAD(P)-dependent oxidoreductase [Actinobacteria bacterium]|nr:SDR family NAD(P)-dependent oxidoreductase [Actinomycetota bacterium]